MAFGGVALKSLSMFLRIVEFGCAAVILALYSYFLAQLSDHNLGIATYIKAVTGISGAAIIYTIFAILLVCCLGGLTFFALLGILLDIAFCGAFIYVAWATRDGSDSCSGYVSTPLGSGVVGVDSLPSGTSGSISLPSILTACRMNKASFAVAIIALILFPISALLEWGLARHHQREKRFGPSPSNGYTSGSAKRKWWRRKRTDSLTEKHPDALPAHVTPADATRTSYATDNTTSSNQPLYQSTHAPTAAYNQNQTYTAGANPYEYGSHSAAPGTAYTSDHARLQPTQPVAGSYGHPYGHPQTRTQDYAANF